MKPIKDITVFGGTGFIGRHVIRHLAPEGTTIRVATRNPEKALFLKPAGNVGQIVPIACNIRDDTSVARAIGTNSGAVINLIGILFEKGRDTFQAMHVEAAARIARLAREEGATSFVHVSSLAADAQSSSAYARSKAAGEEAVRAFFAEATILRPSLVFGPEDDFFNRFATLARFLPVLPLIGGGNTKFQPVYVGDIAKAVIEILYRPEARGEIYALGGPSVYSFRELMEIMLREIGRRRRLFDMSWPLAKAHAALHEVLPLPRPAITRDQVELLKSNNVIRDARTKTLRSLNITPTSLEVILPTYLDRFRVGGRLKEAA